MRFCVEAKNKARYYWFSLQKSLVFVPWMSCLTCPVSWMDTGVWAVAGNLSRMSTSHEKWIDGLHFSSLFWPPPQDEQQRQVRRMILLNLFTMGYSHMLIYQILWQASEITIYFLFSLCTKIITCTSWKFILQHIPLFLLKLTLWFLD